MTEKNGVERSTATEILRRLLDERGVEWDYGIRGATTTRFNANGVDLTFTPMRDGLVCSTILTPEQAIAATLGSCSCSCSCPNSCTNSERTETCYDTGESRIFHCSECGLGLDDVFIDDEEYYPFADFPRFCPFCGAKVVGE